MRHALLGPACGERGEIGRELERWTDFVEIEAVEDVADRAAEMLAEGQILGWVQGRSEFGPRALGSRSIVADPRPASNKDLINAMIKKREAFRPFAPSVLEEEADEYFELPPHQTRFPFMVFAVKVREPYRPLLGAVTHVDGTARIQTVDRETNPRYWALIDAFRRRTGVAVVLNTSFNNNAEPIVNTVRDAVACYLTTGLDGLVAGDWVVRKKEVGREHYARLRPSLASYTRIHRGALRGPAPQAAAGGGPFYRELFDALWPRDQEPEHALGNTHDGRKVEVSAAMASLLGEADGHATLGELAARFPGSERERLIDEAVRLWTRRAVRLLPDP
jgi:carbamoyltransferase